MGRRDLVMGLDVGTTKVVAMIGETRDSGHTRVTGIGLSASRGMRRGVVVDIESTVRAIIEAVVHAERMAGLRMKSAYVGIAGGHIAAVNNRGVVAVAGEDREITAADVDRVLEAARVISMPPDREIIHVIPRQFIVDGYNGIRDPVGMSGQRLEVEAHIVTGAITSIQNLLRSIYKAGIEVEDIVLVPLASGEAVLLPEEKELGAVVADIGGGTTGVAIFREGTLWFSSVLPVGGEHVTSDVAIGLRTPLPHAEKVKVERGVATVAAAREDEFIDIPGIGGREARRVSEKTLAAIVEPRMDEIFSLLGQEVKRSGYDGLIPGGLVLTGGTSLMKGAATLAEERLNLPVRLGKPEDVSGIMDATASPVYATAVGLIRYGSQVRSFAAAAADRGGAWTGLLGRLRGWLRDLF